MTRGFALLFIVSSLTVGRLAAQQLPTPLKQPETPSPAAAPAGAENTRQPEDWTQLPVDRKVLKPILTGVSLGKAETPDFTREIIRLVWRQGDPIDIYLITPHAVKKPQVVLYLYSYPSNNERFRGDGWCRHVTSKGLAAVGFVSALTGERYRYRSPKQSFLTELEESLGSSVHDVQLILDYLAAREDLSADKVAMWGQGSGGSIAILAAAVDPRIAVVDVLNPWGDWPDWLKSSPVVPDDQRANFLAPEFLQKISMLDPVDWLPRLRDRSMRLQQIMDDPDTPQPASGKIAAAVPHGRLVVQYKDLDAHRDAWKAMGVSGWIATQLLPQAQPTVQSASGGHR